MFYLTAKTVNFHKLATDLLEHLLNIDLEKQIAYPIERYCNLVTLNVISFHKKVDYILLFEAITNICSKSNLVIEIPEKYSDYNFLIKKKIPLNRLTIRCSNVNTCNYDHLSININHNIDTIMQDLNTDSTDWRTIYYDLQGIFNLKNKYDGNITVKDLKLYNKNIFNINTKFRFHIYDLLLKTYSTKFYNKPLSCPIIESLDTKFTYLPKEENDIIINEKNKVCYVTGIPIYMRYFVIKIYEECLFKKIKKSSNSHLTKSNEILNETNQNPKFLFDKKMILETISTMIPIKINTIKIYEVNVHNKYIFVVSKKRNLYVFEDDTFTSFNTINIIDMYYNSDFENNLNEKNIFKDDDIYIMETVKYESPIYKYLDFATYAYFSREFYGKMINKEYSIHKFPYFESDYSIIDNIDIPDNLKKFYKINNNGYYDLNDDMDKLDRDDIICSYNNISINNILTLNNKIYVNINRLYGFNNYNC